MLLASSVLAKSWKPLRRDKWLSLISTIFPVVMVEPFANVAFVEARGLAHRYNGADCATKSGCEQGVDGLATGAGSGFYLT
jgi:hypothetical protein